MITSALLCLSSAAKVAWPRAPVRAKREKKGAAPAAETAQEQALTNVAVNHTLAATPLVGVRSSDLLGAAGALVLAVGTTRLEAGLQEDVVLRIATMEKIPQAALMELQTILRSKLSLAGAFKARPVDGARTVAGIINGVGSGTEGRIIEALSKVDRSLTEKIQDLMFVFDNLIGLDDKSMQVLLREVSNDVLALALKGAVEPMREKVFRNMSKRAGEILQEDMEARGPVKMSEVEAAQKEIVTVARRLSEEGQITLATGREDYVE